MAGSIHAGDSLALGLILGNKVGLFFDRLSTKGYVYALHSGSYQAERMLPNAETQ
jgi:hypothetical protein